MSQSLGCTSCAADESANLPSLLCEDCARALPDKACSTGDDNRFFPMKALRLWLLCDGDYRLSVRLE